MTPRYGRDHIDVDNARALHVHRWTEQTCTLCQGSRRQPYGAWTVTCGRCMGWGVIYVKPGVGT